MKLLEIEHLVSELFALSWSALHAPGVLARAGLEYPGVYLIAYSDRDLRGVSIDPGDVLYVGMSNSGGGVRSRVKQFMGGIENGKVHSGAMRFNRDYCGGRPFSELNGASRLYFASLTIPCVANKGAAQPDDLREMGHVACLEYMPSRISLPSQAESHH